MNMVMQSLLMCYDTPSDDLRWFLSPRQNMAIALPESWIMTYPPDKSEWMIRHDVDQYWQNGGPEVCGILYLVDGGPAKVRERLNFYQKQDENNDNLMIFERFHDSMIPLHNFGFECRFQKFRSNVRYAGRYHYYAFEESGCILKLRATCGVQQWGQWEHLFEMCFRNLVIFETKEFWSRN